MDSKKVFSIILIIVGFSTSGYFVVQNNELSNQVNSLEVLIDQQENSITNLTITCDKLVSHVTSLEEDNQELITQVNNVQSELILVISERNDLEEEVDQLQEDVNSLQIEKQDLQIEKRSLQIEKLSLEETLVSERASYSSLHGRWTDLLDYSYQLEIDYSIEKELRIGNSLESYYDILREGLGPTGARYWWRSSEKSVWQTEVNFAGNLALHDLWRLYWPDYETEYEELTGENSYETAWNTLSAIVDYIDISSLDTLTEKISKILSFLDEHIHYESEVNDVFLAPVETLGFKSGDCDDYSILAAALFEWVDIETAIGFYNNDFDEYHAMTLIHVDELDYPCWFFEDLTNLGLSDGCWLIIEPQMTISNQDSEWIGQWSIFVAEELDYNE